MMAMVSAMAGRVSESEFARVWRMAGDAIDFAVPIALTAVLVVGWGWLLLNPVP